MRRFILSLFILSLCVSITAQQNNVWIFGNLAGMDFNPSPPVPVSSSLNTLEATASVCDNNGNLLFYTNSTTVWDKNGNVMPNGNGLLGGTSATQVLIVQKPLDCSKYYIFHVADHQSGPGDFRYTLVDMCLNNGQGDVVVATKNILLHQPCGEKITAVPHSNGVDVWVITHELSSNNFRTYLVTGAGINPAVISGVGGVHASNHMIGPVKASHNGQKLAIANTFGTLFEVFDFNSTTGVVSNPVNFFPAVQPFSSCVYGLEFSPNDQLLYAATCWTGNSVLQIDVATQTTTQLAQISGWNQYLYGMLQLGPDGRMYLARNNQNFLDVIGNPNVPGPGCGYVAAGFNLSPGSLSTMGLPNFIPSALIAQPVTNFISLGNDTALCPFNPYTINLSGTPCNSTYLWSNGNTTASFNVTGFGTYWVIVNNACGSDTDTVVVSPGQGALTVASTTPSICQGSFDTLTVTGATTYAWSPSTGLSATTGATVYANPTVTTTYTVIGSSVCGTDTAVITITVLPSPLLSPVPDTSFCSGNSVVLNSGGAANYAWTPSSSLSNSTGANVVASPSATTSYTVTGTGANGCTSTDVFVITVNPAPNVTVSNSQGFCTGDVLALSAAGGTSYTWSPGTGLSATTGANVNAAPSVSTTYTVTGINSSGCADTAQVTLTVVTNSQSAFTFQSEPCNSMVSFTDHSQGVVDYLWYFGDGDSSMLSNPTHIYTLSGTYQIVLVVNPGSNCSDTSIVTFNYESSDPGDVYIPNAFTPNGDFLNPVFRIYGPVDCLYKELQVFNRWGELIWFTSNPMYEFWDGKVSGQIVEEGVYIWRLIKKDDASRVGHVTVIR